MPQPQPRQLFGFNDMPMLQRHIMFKQMQELQQRQQLQDLGDTRQQHYITQLTAGNRQAIGGQLPHLVHGTPIHDPQTFMAGNMNLAQIGGSPAVHGFPNGELYSQAQSQALHSVGLVPQQLDVSTYGTAIASARNNMSQYPHMQETSNDSDNAFTRVSYNQSEKAVMRPSAFGDSYLADNCNLASDVRCMPNGAFMSKQVLQDTNMYGQIPIPGLNSGILSENAQQVSSLQRNASSLEFSGRQEQASWPGHFPGKSTQVNPSLGLATLDPLEEKILFNMDDHSWNASFGRHAEIVTRGSRDTLESTDDFSSFPSIQSGSWSALMQSAVAEASSSDTGVQEEWSGLSFQNTELSADNQPSNFVDSGKQHTGWFGNSLQSTSTLNSKPQLISDSNIGSILPGFQQSGIQFQFNQREKYSGSSQETMQQLENNLSNCSPHQKQLVEGSQPVQTLLGLENERPYRINEHLDTDRYQQNMSSYNNRGQVFEKQISMTRESPSPSGSAARSISHIENAVSKSRAGDTNRGMYMGFGPDSCSGKDENHRVANSFPNSANRLIMRQIKENSGNDQDQLSDSLHEGTDGTCNKQRKCYQRESSCDSYHSNTSKQTIAGHGLRENMCLHDSDSPPVEEGNIKSSGQVIYQQLSQGVSSQEQGYLRQINLMDDISKGVVKLEKGRSPVGRGYSSALEDAPPRGFNGANISGSTDRLVGFYPPNKLLQPSQNMLQHLHNVDHVRENNNRITFASSDCKPQLKVPEAERPEAFVAQQSDHSSASQNFGLRLAPPSQRLPNRNNVFSFHSAPEMVNSTAVSSSAPSYLKNQLEKQHFPSASMPSQLSQTTLPGIASVSPRCNISNLSTSQDVSHTWTSNPFGQQYPILEAVPVPQHSVMSGMSQQVAFAMRPPGMWKNISMEPHLSGIEPHNVSSSLRLSSDSTKNNQETTSLTPHQLHDRSSYRGTTPLEYGTTSLNSEGFDHGEEKPGKERSRQQASSEILDSGSKSGGVSQGEELPRKHLLEENAIGSSPVTARSHQQDLGTGQHGGNKAPAVSERDIEAFGRSLKPLHVLQQDYSPLHQVHSVKNAETGPSKGVSGIYNGTDSYFNAQQVNAVAGDHLMYGHNSVAKSSSNNEVNAASGFPSLPIRDSRIHPSDKREDQSVEGSLQPLYQDIPQQMVMVGQSKTLSHSSGSNMAYLGTEHSQVRFQMAPSWFKHYGSLRNGQILPKYDAKTANSATQQLPRGKQDENLHMNTSMVSKNGMAASQIVSSDWVVAAKTLAMGKRVPPYVLTQEVGDRTVAVMRPKKRKFAVSGLLPWHKEVTIGSQRPEIISMAELEWAKAANRLIEKRDDETELTKVVQPALRPKKRLILTTKLMQQVFRAAPASVLSVDATLNYDSMAYFTARLVLGDACSLTSSNNSHLLSENCDMMSKKSQVPEKPGAQFFSKIAEDLTEQAEKMETNFLRLEKMASILDFKMEIQELDKFSIINRFAKFHSRGQMDAAGTCSSSSTPQRYVAAFPMPRTVPDGAQCLSL